jgi:type I restriction enzyme S subunit
MNAETFREHFDTFAEAPNGVAKLRELILQLAVQGKLGTEDLTDEPSGELLQRIALAKAEMLRSKTITARDSQFITDEEIPFVVPDSWRWCRLCDIAHDLGQRTPEERFTYIDVGTINKERGVVSDNVQVLEANEAPSRARKIVAVNSVIYSTVRPYLLNVAVIETEFTPTPIVSTAFAVLHPHDGMVSRFIYHYLRSKPFVAYVESEMTGVAYPAINDGKMYRGLIPVPPTAEQRRIVAKVDQLMGLCDELASRQAARHEARKALVGATLDRLVTVRSATEFPSHAHRLRDHFDRLFDTPTTIPQLRQAILQLAVQGQLVPQDPCDEPACDEEIPLAKLLSEDSLNGYSKAPSNAPPGVPILRISAGTSRRDFIVDETDHKWVSEARDVEKFVLQPNDLLACRFNGNLHYVGRFSLYLGTTGQKQINPDKLIRFRVDLTRCDPRYVCFAMNSRKTRDKIEAFCATTAGNIGISASNLKTVAIRVPPLSEQHRIVSKVTELLSLCDTLEAKLMQAESASTQLLSAAVHQMLTKLE